MRLLSYVKLVWLCTRIGVLSNSVSNGDIIFSPIQSFSNYSLAQFTSKTLQGTWSLDPYVNLARGFILGLVDYNKIQGNVVMNACFSSFCNFKCRVLFMYDIRTTCTHIKKREKVYVL